MRSAVPPGWEENPTAWPKRRAIAAVAFVGLAVSTYLTLYQVGVLSDVWDPFFPHGTPAVLDWTKPFPDGALGVAAYGAEIILSFVGGADRWRTMPWTVIAFAAVMVSGAVTSVALMIIQPVAVGDWCTLCLASAAVSLLILPWGIDEPLAGLQHLARVRACGRSVWRALWGLEERAWSDRSLRTGR